jgi:hypothetical protein
MLVISSIKKILTSEYTIIELAWRNPEYQKNELGLNEEVIFLDRVPYNEVLQMMQETHIPLPSVEEGIAM